MGSGPGEEGGDVCARPGEGAVWAGPGGRRRGGRKRMHQAEAAVEAAAAAAAEAPAAASPPRTASRPLGVSFPQARPRRPVDGGRGLSAEAKELVWA